MAVRFAELPDCPTQDAKVALLFEEFDVRLMGCIDIEGMLVVFNKLNMGCSNATVNDLYERADVDGDGVVNAADFAKFAEMYPTLVDCLYYRMKDYWYVVDQKEEIERASGTLQALKDRKDEIQRELEAQMGACDAGQLRMETQMCALQESQAREGESKRALDTAHESSERVRCELRDRVYGLNAAKDSEKQCVAVLHERQRVLEHSIQRLQNQEAEVVKAQERLRDIERMLADQQREVERQIQGAERCRQEAEGVEMKEQEAESAAEASLQVVHAAADAVTAAEAKLAHSADAERLAGRRLKEAADETARYMAKRDAEQAQLQAAKEEEARKKAEVGAASEAISEQTYYLDQLMQESSDFAEKRRQVDEEELQLIDQEVQLRRQRATLEKHEHKLRSDFSAFAYRQTLRGVDAPRIADVTQVMQHHALPPVGMADAAVAMTADGVAADQLVGQPTSQPQQRSFGQPHVSVGGGAASPGVSRVAAQEGDPGASPHYSYAVPASKAAASVPPSAYASASYVPSSSDYRAQATAATATSPVSLSTAPPVSAGHAAAHSQALSPPSALPAQAARTEHPTPHATDVSAYAAAQTPQKPVSGSQWTHASASMMKSPSSASASAFTTDQMGMTFASTALGKSQ